MSGPSYAAPALEKGLEILELMAGQSAPLNQAEIAAKLGRSKAEIYRMLMTLEHQNFIRRDATGAGFEMTSRLFDLGMLYPVRGRLINAAMPRMRNLARETGQSCHLTLLSGGAIVAAAQVESEASAGFSVKVGFRVAVVRCSSGRVIYAFQTPERQSQWRENMSAEADELEAFLTDAATAASQGYLVRDSYYTLGITDLVAPVLSDDKRAIAALVVPFMEHMQNEMSQAVTLEKLLATARLISGEMGDYPPEEDRIWS